MCLFSWSYPCIGIFARFLTHATIRLFPWSYNNAYSVRTCLFLLPYSCNDVFAFVLIRCTLMCLLSCSVMFMHCFVMHSFCAHVRALMCLLSYSWSRIDTFAFAVMLIAHAFMRLLSRSSNGVFAFALILIYWYVYFHVCGDISASMLIQWYMCLLDWFRVHVYTLCTNMFSFVLMLMHALMCLFRAHTHALVFLRSHSCNDTFVSMLMRWNV